MLRDAMLRLFLSPAGPGNFMRSKYTHPDERTRAWSQLIGISRLRKLPGNIKFCTFYFLHIHARLQTTRARVSLRVAHDYLVETEYLAGESRPRLILPHPPPPSFSSTSISMIHHCLASPHRLANDSLKPKGNFSPGRSLIFFPRRESRAVRSAQMLARCHRANLLYASFGIMNARVEIYIYIYLYIENAHVRSVSLYIFTLRNIPPDTLPD